MADSFQWERCDSGGGSCVDIPGETNPTYVLTAADIGSTIRARGTRDGVLIGESAPTAPVISAPAAYATATAYTQTRPGFSTIRALTATSPSDLSNKIANARAGDYITARGFTYPGTLTIARFVAGGVAVIDLGTGADRIKFVGQSSPQNEPAFYLRNPGNLRIYGGEITNPVGGSGAEIYHCDNILWWDFEIHDTATTGLSVFPVFGDITNLDLAGEIHDCVTQAGVTAWDPHIEKGTGLHGANLCDAQYSLRNFRIALNVHDQDWGNAVELGQPAANMVIDNGTIYLRAVNINYVKNVGYVQSSGHALDLWGNRPMTRVVIPYLEATNVQGRAIDNLFLSSKTVDVKVLYGRATNCCLNPHLGSLEPGVDPHDPWPPHLGIVYEDVA